MKMRWLIPLLALACDSALANTCTARQAGTTDQTVYVTFMDSTTGVPTAGLAFNSSGIDIEYVRTAATAVDLTEATQTTNGAHADGGFVSVGHGRYRLDLPDAAVAAGVPEVVIQGIITGYIMAPCSIALSPPVTVVDIAAGAIVAADFTAGAIDASAIAADAIGASEIATDAIGAAEIASAAIAAAEIADGAIDEATYATTAGAFASLGIVDQGTAQSATGTTLVLRAAAAFADDEIIGATCLITGGTTGVGQSRAITDYVSTTDTATVATWTTTPTGTIVYKCFGTSSGSGSVAVAAGGITTASFATGAIDAAAIAADAIGASELATGALTTAEFAAGAIDAAAIATDAIGAAELAANSITSSEVADDSIDAGALAADAIGASEVAANALGASEIATDAIGSAEIASAAIAADEVATDAIGAAEFAADAATETGTAVIVAQGAITGTCDSGSTTTCVDNALTQADATQLEDRLICFDDGWCGLITTFTPASDTATTTKVAPSTRASKVYTIFPSTLE